MGKTIFLTFFIFFLLLSGASFVYADPEVSDPAQKDFQLVPCTGLDCTFAHLIELLQRVINFLIFIAVALAAVVFAYAGFLYLSSAGNQAQVQKAHGIFVDVFFGLIIALAAWLIVNAIAATLLKESFFNTAFWFL